MSARPTPEVYELEITLLEIEPRIWRRIALPSDLTLAALHPLIQLTMGWEDAHLHQFVAEDGRRYGLKDAHPDLDDLFARAEDTRKVQLGEVLREPGEALRYDYDFGDSWEHRVELVAVRPAVEGEPLPRCLDGARACPPEDCGGTWGYEELLEALADADHERHDELREWVGGAFDPEAFEVDAVNAALRSVP